VLRNWLNKFLVFVYSLWVCVNDDLELPMEQECYVHDDLEGIILVFFKIFLVVNLLSKSSIME
jgi:hypothetical protein